MGLDPESDFNYLGNSCSILFKHHREETISSDDSNTCWDHYTYLFNIEGSGQSYNSEEESIKRQDDACSGALARSKYQPNDVVECWQAKALPVSDVYNCPNTACVKLVNPSAEVAAAVEDAWGFIGGGSALILGCLVCNCCGIFCWQKSKQEEPVWQQTPHQAAAPTVIGTAVHAGMPAASPVTVPVVSAPVVSEPVVSAPVLTATVVSAPVSIQVQVPVGAMPGQTIQAQAPDGRTLQAAVPAGAKPGDVFTMMA